MTRRNHFIALCAAILFCAVGSWAAVVVPVGTSIPVRLNQTLSSDASQAGQQFTGVLSEALVVNGKTIAPKGANVFGTVATARPSGRLKTTAALYLRLTGIEIGGQRHAVVTGLRGRTGPSHKKRNIGMIGGGAGLGAVIGAVAGGGKGAAIGAAAGAGAGTAAAAATGKKDVTYPAETLVSFRLSRILTVP